ncbi:DDE-type integrase/transposase/recombinase [Campylobacter sp. RM9334]|uniref:DDE-type integrase/transposase/recombinase n=1 Tax=Campylobacter sp. RM9334 TaxID=2735732 RepID=UPI001DD54E27|nr:DDE-type integrase/transposase/recombinase [Campylobacter sp. RM9334]
MPFIATKYAALIFKVTESNLRYAAINNSKKYTYTKFQNKLLFKVTSAQLRIALNKGLIDANIEVYNDELVLIQDFFKTNNEKQKKGEINANNKENSSDIRNNCIDGKHDARDREARARIYESVGCNDTRPTNAGENKGTRELTQSTSTLLSTTKKLSEHSSSKASNIDEQSTLNECLNERNAVGNYAPLSIQLDTTQSKNISKKELIYDVICEYVRRGFSIKSACAKLGISRQQYYRLAKKYEENGLLGFVDKRTIKKASRIGECIPKYLRELALNLWRKSGAGGISYAELHEILHENAKNFDFKGFLLKDTAELFSVKTLQNYIENYKKEHLLEAVMVEQGEDKAKSYLQPAMGDSKARVSARNEIWQIDSSKLDMFVIDDEGNEFRPDILSVVDVFSGRCVATLADKSNGLSLIRLLWKAISELGIPKKIKGDNGKDYLGSTFQHTLQKLNIAYENTPPYSGEKKAMVERHFKTLQHSFISFAPGYIGHNLAKREKIEQRTAKKDRSAKNAYGKVKKTNQKHLLSFEEALNLLDKGVAKWNMQRHRVKSGVSRLDLWNSCTNTITKITYEYFLARAGESIVKKVQKTGINLNKRTYISADMPLVGTELLVCINIDNVSELYMYSKDAEFIGIAYDKQIANISLEELKAHQKEFKQAQSKVRKVIKKAELSDFTQTSVEYDLKIREKEHNELLNTPKNNVLLDDKTVSVYKANKKLLDEVRLSFEDYEISESKDSKDATWESIFDDVNVG